MLLGHNQPKVSAGELAGALQCASGFQDRQQRGAGKRPLTVADFNYRTATAYFDSHWSAKGDNELREWIRAMYRTAQPLRPFRGRRSDAAAAIGTAQCACRQLQNAVGLWSGDRTADPCRVAYDDFNDITVASKLLYECHDKRAERAWLAIAEPERQQPDPLPYLKAAVRIGTAIRSFMAGLASQQLDTREPPVMPTLHCAVFTVQADGEVERADLDPNKCYAIGGDAINQARSILTYPDGIRSERPGTSMCRSCKRAEDGTCTYAVEIPPD